jgi:hypothetical protein
MHGGEQPVLLLQLDEFVRDVERCHHGNALGTKNATGVAYLSHLVIQVAGGDQQLVLLVLRADYGIFLAEEMDFDRRFCFVHYMGPSDCKVDFRLTQPKC